MKQTSYILSFKGSTDRLGDGAWSTEVQANRIEIRDKKIDQDTKTKDSAINIRPKLENIIIEKKQ